MSILSIPTKLSKPLSSLRYWLRRIYLWGFAVVRVRREKVMAQLWLRGMSAHMRRDIGLDL